MRHRSWSIGIIAITCGLLAHAGPARAAAETWVSGTGVNSGACEITAPCRSFQFAHGKTTAGGVINVLSPGNFGPLNITKSISIVADGVEALILKDSASGAAISIQAAASDIVSLQGVTIDLRGSGGDGILFLSGAALHVHKSGIRGSVNAINFTPASGTSELYVVDAVIAESSSQGIRVLPSGSAGAKVVLDRVRMENNSQAGVTFLGSSTTGSITATVRDSVSAGNGFGINAVDSDSSGGTTTVMIDHAAAVNNTNGIRAQGGRATIRIGDSTVSGNNTGLSAVFSGVIASYGTNKVDGNGTDGNPTTTITTR